MIGHSSAKDFLEGAVTVRVSIDRFEGDRMQIAVLLAEDGTAINFPKALSLTGAKAGDILAPQIERDVVASRKLAEDTRRVQDELRKTDPGGDLKALLSLIAAGSKAAGLAPFSVRPADRPG